MKKILTVLLLLSLTAISFGTIKSAGGGGSGYTLFTQFGQEGATAGQVLSWDGANWVPDTVSGSVTDTTVTSNYYASIVSINNNLVVSGNIIVNGGMVGIGTANPMELLHVYNGNTILENAYFYKVKNNAGGAVGILRIDSSNWTNISCGNSATGIKFFDTNSNEMGRITDKGSDSEWYINGNVGIGTINPTAKLHVEDDTDNELIVIQSNDNLSYITLKDDDTEGQIGVEGSLLGIGVDSGAGVNNLNIFLSGASVGNVGIGTTNPRVPLEVSGNVYIIDDGSNPILMLGDSPAAGNYGALRWASAADQLSIYTSAFGTTQLVLQEDGQVGINNAGPAYTLDVTGTINASLGVTTSAIVLNGVRRTSWVAGSAIYRNLFAPDSMDFLIEDVPVSGSVLSVVSGNTSIPCMLMDDTVTEGRKVVVYVPVGMTSIDWEFTGKSTVPTANDIDITLYSREISTNALMSAWETYDLGTWDLILNDFMETKTATTALSTLGWVAGRSYQLIIARGAARAADTLIGDFQLIGIRMDIE